MKKNFILLVVCALALVSCLGDSYYEATFSPVDTFEGFQDEDKDSLFFGPSFYTSFLRYHNYADGLESGAEASRLEGGFGISSRLVRWSLEDNSASENAVPLEGGDTPEYINDNLFMTVFQKLDGKSPEKNSYAVFYDSDASGDVSKHHITFMATNGGTWTPKACYIANTAFTVARATGKDISGYPEDYASYPEFTFKRHTADAGQTSEENDGNEEVSGNGDFIKIIAKGYKDGSDTEVGTAEIYLVDYIDGQSDSLLTSWKPLDFSKFGDVNYIDFTVECSVAGFPVYFCLDEMTSNVHIKQ